MGQRLGIAAALLGDPEVLLLDEPVNGLDPEGIRWMRNLLQQLAAEGRTVFISSHLMSEMALTATELVVVGRGRLVASGTVDELTARRGGSVFVRSEDNARLAQLLAGPGRTVTATGADGLRVTGMDSSEIGRASVASGIPLIELTPQSVTLEEAFMEITRDDVVFQPTTNEAVQS
jgi:ABC-2 type transport system ATP-binding protein